MHIPSRSPSPSSRRVAAIREAKDAFLAPLHLAPGAPLEPHQLPSSLTSSIVVAPATSDGNDSSSSYEHVCAEQSPKEEEDKANAIRTEFPVESTTELRSPKLLARVNSIPKPPRHSLERSVTVADVIEMQPLLEGRADDADSPPTPPTSPMPKDDKGIAFAKSNVD